MNTHRFLNVSLALAFSIFAAAALSTAHLLGPDDIDTDRMQANDLQAAKHEAQRQARFEKAVRQACGENSAYIELSDGAVQCFTHRGFKTQIAKVNP